MVISTPRLCNDAAFRPPKGPKPHPIACSPIIASESMQAYIEARESAAAEHDADFKASAMKGANQFLDQLKNVLGVETVDAKDEIFEGEDEVPAGDLAGQIDQIIKKNLPRVGDILVGGHNIVPEGTVLQKGLVVGGTGDEKHIATIASSDGYTASEKDLANLNIRGANELEKIKDKVRQRADGADWQIDVVENNRGVKEIRGIFGNSKKEKAQKAKLTKNNKAKEKQAAKEEAQDHDNEADDNNDSEEGSEERYKEEL
jgi:protein OS-9